MQQQQQQQHIFSFAAAAAALAIAALHYVWCRNTYTHAHTNRQPLLSRSLLTRYLGSPSNLFLSLSLTGETLIFSLSALLVQLREREREKESELDHHDHYYYYYYYYIIIIIFINLLLLLLLLKTYFTGPKDGGHKKEAGHCW